MMQPILSDLNPNLTREKWMIYLKSEFKGTFSEWLDLRASDQHAYGGDKDK